MQRTGFLVRQAAPRESVEVAQELVHLLFLLEQVSGPGVARSCRGGGCVATAMQRSL
jgi:hypothetical protein